MARKWTKQEETSKRIELRDLYIKQNKTIGEIGKILGLKENTVYDRMVRLGIPSLRHKKIKYNNLNNNILVPKKMSGELAEFIGILLGDGHLTPTQITVTLGTKERQYAQYVQELMERIFGVKPKIAISTGQCLTVYLGSTVLVRWFLNSFNLVYNKVKYQVDVPGQCFQNPIFISRTLRGMFDTDGSVYRLRHGIQMSFTNKSRPLLRSAKIMLEELGLHPSNISHNKIYITRKLDISNFVQRIGFANSRHLQRIKLFNKGGSYSGNYT